MKKLLSLVIICAMVISIAVPVWANTEDIIFDCPNTVILPPNGRISSFVCTASAGTSPADISVTSGGEYARVYGNRLVLTGKDITEKTSITLLAKAGGISREKTVTVIPPIYDDFDALATGAQPVAKNSSYSWDSVIKYNAAKSKHEAGMYMSASNGRYNGRMYFSEPVDASYGKEINIEFSSGMYYNASIVGGPIGALVNHDTFVESSTYDNSAILAGVTSNCASRQTTQYDFFTMYDKNGSGSINLKDKPVLEDAELDKFFDFRLSVNMVAKTYDLYIDEKKVLDDYAFNTAAESTQIKSILWQSNFDDVAVYTGDLEPETGSDIPEKIIAPPSGVVSKIPMDIGDTYTCTPESDDYDLSYDNGYLYITGNGQETSSAASLSLTGKNITLEKELIIKPAIEDDFNSYTNGAETPTFNVTDSYVWMPSRANASKPSSSPSERYLAASNGRYSGFISLNEKIDQCYSDIVTVEVSVGFYNVSGIAGNLALGLFSNKCYTEPDLQNEADMVSRPNLADANALLGLVNDKVDKDASPFNTYLTYDATGTGSITSRTEAVKTGIEHAEWHDYRFVLDLNNGSYTLYIDSKKTAENYLMNKNALVKEIKSIAFLNPIDNFAIYSGTDKDFTELLDPYIISVDHSQDGVPIYGYYKGGKLTGNIKVTNNYIDSLPVTAITALYKDGTLEAVSVETENIAKGQEKTLSPSVNITDYAGTTVKTFVLDNQSNLSPYMEAENLKGMNYTDDYTVFLIGDSVCQEYDSSKIRPIQGWGYYMQENFGSNVTVENYAVSGWATSQYLEKWPTGASYSNYLWKNILPQIDEGDYVMVALGINDNNSSGTYGTSEAQYKENLKQFYADVNKKGAEIIYITPTTSTGPETEESGKKFYNTWRQRGEWMSQVAQQSGAYCFDLGAYCTTLYNNLMKQYNTEAGLGENDPYGYNKVCYRFNIFRTNLLQSKADGGFGMTEAEIETYGVAKVKKNAIGYDGTHLNDKSAKEIAKIICDNLKTSSDLPIADDIK